MVDWVTENYNNNTQEFCRGKCLKPGQSTASVYMQNRDGDKLCNICRKIAICECSSSTRDQYGQRDFVKNNKPCCGICYNVLLNQLNTQS